MTGPRELQQRLKKAVEARRARAEAATPGPWQHVDFHDGTEMSTFMGCGSVITLANDVMGGDIAAPSGDLYPRSGYSPKEDMAFIAAENPKFVLDQCSEDLHMLTLYGDYRRIGFRDQGQESLWYFVIRSMARRYGVQGEDD